MARQKFGQHFLIDENWQRRIVSLFHPEKDFAEIGPGEGAITRHLAERFENFFCFEVDPKIKEKHKFSDKYEVVLKDFLEWDFCDKNQKKVSDFSLIGNLPYESGTKMLVEIAKHSSQISHFVFMLQEEVAERIAARPSSKAFGSLSVFMQSQYNIEIFERILPEAFSPPPKVFSKVIRGYCRTDKRPIDSEFSEFVKLAFGKKRKTLRNVLKSNYDDLRLKNVFDELGFDDKVRAEEISVDVWPKLYELLGRADENL